MNGNDQAMEQVCDIYADFKELRERVDGLDKFVLKQQGEIADLKRKLDNVRNASSRSR